MLAAILSYLMRIKIVFAQLEHVMCVAEQKKIIVEYSEDNSNN